MSADKLADTAFAWLPNTSRMWIGRITDTGYIRWGTHPRRGATIVRGSDEPDVIALFKRILADGVPENVVRREFRWVDEFTERTPRWWGVITAGKQYYWAVYLFRKYVRGYGNPDDTSWLIGEGFEPTLEAAQGAAHALASAEGPAGRYSCQFVQNIYRDRHGRKPKPSAETSPGGDLGYLWSFHHSTGEFDGEQDWWHAHRITKVTAKKVLFISGYCSADTQQASVDRAKLEREGGAWSGRGTGRKWFHTTTSKEEFETARRSQYRNTYPLLGIAPDATEADILRAFRTLAKTAHPDAGGDAAMFRDLVAEKDRALARAQS